MLALVMIYRATHHVNFGQGEMAMFSTYIAWSLLEASVPYWVAGIAAIAFGFAAGALIERVALRPLHNAPLLSIVTVFVALMIIIQSAAGLLFGHESHSFASPFEAWSPWARACCRAVTPESHRHEGEMKHAESQQAA
ncbi:ABC transporter permease subunit [Variovorax paradoxus]|uniref:ABC transporter permease subunit n=1 Tax=Variovorax paradoxus TaxID=34073 RepID=UPI001934947B|nr:hypothetical protein INQ48_35165 [Variovorax paradoxus]